MKNFIVPIIFLSLLLFSEIFCFRAIRRFFSNRNQKYVVAIYWAITLIEFAFFFITRTWDNHPRNIAINVLIIIISMKLFAGLSVLGADITRAIRFFFEKKENITPQIRESRRDFVGKLALGMAGIPFISMNYGIFKTAFAFKIHRELLKFNNFPAAFNGLKIVQISDIHTGSLVNANQLNKAIDLILAEKPDLILFTGDLVNNRTDEAYPYKESFKRLQAPMGVYSVLGNHDYGDYETWDTPESKAKNFQDMIDLHAELGWKLMMNEAQIFEKDGEKFALLGIENWGNNLHFPKYGVLSKALEEAGDAPFKILMSHDPSHWDAEVNDGKTDIDLALAGHTHGFQFGVEIPGFRWSPSQYAYKQWAGLYKNKEQVLYVNRGLGCIGYMGRIGIRPEITVLEFTQA